MSINTLVEYIPNAIPKELGDNLTHEITFPKQREKCKIFGKIYDTPRDQALFHFCKNPVTYKYSGISIESKPATESLWVIRNWIFENIGTANGKYDIVLVNRYLSGKDKVGWHADDEKTIDQSFPIISVSFGGSRKFQIRLKKGNERPITNFNLNSGDVIIMNPGCQEKLIHQIPITTAKVGTRFNLTFRSSK